MALVVPVERMLPDMAGGVVDKKASQGLSSALLDLLPHPRAPMWTRRLG